MGRKKVKPRFKDYTSNLILSLFTVELESRCLMNNRNNPIHNQRSSMRSDLTDNTEAEHFDEMVGSIEFTAYRHRTQNLNGLSNLTILLQQYGIEVFRSHSTFDHSKDQVETITISGQGHEIPSIMLKKIHNWAHRRKLTHSFYKSR